jgi:glycosyltransferase involved in cell wall biosynthesis
VRMGADRTAPVGDGWYGILEGTLTLPEAIERSPVLRRLPAPMLRLLMARSTTRGALLFAVSVRHPTIGMARQDPGWGTLLLLRAVLGRRRKLVVFQHILHPRRHPLRRLLRAYDRWAIRRTLLRGHALSRADQENLPRHYGLSPERFVYVPWPLAMDPPEQLPPPASEPLVLSAGRAYCDWPTLFAAARGANWPLTVVSDRKDRRRVRRLNEGVNATLLSEIPREDFYALVRRATVSVAAMAEVNTSQGHIRVMDAANNGVPLVVSETASVADYVEHGRTALVVPPGDPDALRAAVERLLGDPELRERLRREAFRAALAWQDTDFLATLADVMHGRPVVLPPTAPGVR